MSEEAFVVVTGHGSATTTPDRVRMHLAAVARAPAVGDAFAAADSGMKAMLAAARDHDVADEDLRSTHVDVRTGRGGRGFRASTGIEVTVHDVAAAGRVLAAMVEAGGDKSRVRGIGLTVAAPEEALAEARAAAWEDALARARQFAELSGRDLGAVLRVREAPHFGGYAMEARGAAVMDFDEASIEPGSQTLSATVTVRWALL